MVKYKYEKVQGLNEKVFTEDGHTMFEEDVLTRLERLAFLESQNLDYKKSNLDSKPKLETLPESFGIMRDANNPLWDKYIAWLRKMNNSNTTPHGQSEWYYGVIHGEYTRNTRNRNAFGTILTLEQWDSIVNGWQPKQGEIIEVSDLEDYYLNDPVKFFSMDGNEYVCRITSDERRFLSWKYARPINPARKKIEELEKEIERLKLEL